MSFAGFCETVLLLIVAILLPPLAVWMRKRACDKVQCMQGGRVLCRNTSLDPSLLFVNKFIFLCCSRVQDVLINVLLCILGYIPGACMCGAVHGMGSCISPRQHCGCSMHAASMHSSDSDAMFADAAGSIHAVWIVFFAHPKRKHVSTATAAHPQGVAVAV